MHTGFESFSISERIVALSDRIANSIRVVSKVVRSKTREQLANYSASITCEKPCKNWQDSSRLERCMLIRKVRMFGKSDGGSAF